MSTENPAAPPPVLFREMPTAGGGRLGIACLNAEKSLNSLTLEMIDLLWQQMSTWARDPGIALVMLEGAGDRAFCAGADLTRLHAACLAHHASAARDDIRANTYALDFFSREYRLDYLLHTYPKPLLCWGQGVVMGGGMGLMAGCSHRVVTDQLRLAMPEINIGLFPDVGGSWFLARAPGHTGIFLALTACQLGAGDAIFAGLADVCIPHARKAEVLQAIVAQTWPEQPTAARQLLSSLLNAHAMASVSDGPLRKHLDLINAACSAPDPLAAIEAVRGLKAQDEWFARGVATLEAGSPSTALLSIALQRRLKRCSLAEVFRAELVAALTCAAKPDLAEGIRALLIDKDRKPRWSPASTGTVDDAWVEGYFRSPWTAEAHPLRDLGQAVAGT